MTRTTISAQRAALLSNPDWAFLTSEARETIADGELALTRLRKQRTIHDWLTVGAACVELRQAAMLRSNSTSASGRRYGDAYDLLAPTELRTMDKANRSKAVQLYSRRDEVLAWYNDDKINSPSDRDRMQHPQTILARYDSWLKAQLPKGDAKPDEPGDGKRRPPEERRKQTAAVAIDNAVERLHDGVDRMERKLSPGLELFDMAPDLIAESARNFVDIFGPADTRRFIEALRALLD